MDKCNTLNNWYNTNTDAPFPGSGHRQMVSFSSLRITLEIPILHAIQHGLILKTNIQSHLFGKLSDLKAQYSFPQ